MGIKELWLSLVSQEDVKRVVSPTNGCGYYESIYYALYANEFPSRIG